MFPNRYFNNTQEVKKIFKSKKFFLDSLMENFSRVWKIWSILKTSTFEQLFSKACTSKNMGDMTKIRLETYQGTLKWHNLRFVGSDLDLYFSTSLHGALHGTPHLPCKKNVVPNWPPYKNQDFRRNPAEIVLPCMVVN